MKDFLTHFHFIRPAALLLVPAALVLWFLWRRGSDPLRGWREQIRPELLKVLVTGGETSGRLASGLLLAGWLSAAVAIAGPAWRLEPNPFADDATPLLVLLKADISMDTPDPAPSRLERARLKIADLSEARKGQPLGLIAYAGSAHLVLPPTRDTAIVASMASEISPQIMPAPGDRLDLALAEASRILDGGGQGGSIVVLADAVDTDPAALKALSVRYPVQFLAIRTPDSPEQESLRSAAHALKGRVEPLTADDRDIHRLVRGAAASPVPREGGESGRWEEAGYWLLPVPALLFLTSFRRVRNQEVTV